LGVYERPKKRVHRGFVYLDDETVVNSLSAIESGKIDEVVGKANSAREGGISGGFKGNVGPVGANLEGGKKSHSSYEEEVVRTRTRISIFEAWYQEMKERQAIGLFGGWGDDALDDVQAGDTVEIVGDLSIVPIQVLVRLFYWFADQAMDQNSMFAQKGDQLKETKTSVKNMRTIFSGSDEILGRLTPRGDEGPAVITNLRPEWMISALGRLEGTYTVIAQVEQVLEEDDSWPTVRLTTDVPVTPLEKSTFASAVANFVEPAKALGIEISEADAAVQGPALLLRPVAIFR